MARPEAHSQVVQLSPVSTSRTFSSFHTDTPSPLHTPPGSATYSLSLNQTLRGPPVSGVTQDVSCVWLMSLSTTSSGASTVQRWQDARPSGLSRAPACGDLTVSITRRGHRARVHLSSGVSPAASNPVVQVPLHAPAVGPPGVHQRRVAGPHASSPFNA